MVADYYDHEKRTCPDDGYCHHECAEPICFRVVTCVPLSISGWEDWPPEIVEKHGGEWPEIEGIEGPPVASDFAEWEEFKEWAAKAPREVLVVSTERFEGFMAALDAPPEVNARLRALFERESMFIKPRDPIIEGDVG